MPRQALLADVLRQADDVYSCAFLLNEAASDGAAPLQAVLEAALLLYTEVSHRTRKEHTCA